MQSSINGVFGVLPVPITQSYGCDRGLTRHMRGHSSLRRHRRHFSCPDPQPGLSLLVVAGSVSIPQQKSTAAVAQSASPSKQALIFDAYKLLKFNDRAKKLGKSPARGRNFTAGPQEAVSTCSNAGASCPICACARFFPAIEKKYKNSDFYRTRRS